MLYTKNTQFDAHLYGT